MKRREFIRKLIKEGCFLYRHGSKHDLYLNPRTGKKTPIPRHKEIRDSLCALIRNQLGLPKD
ncbi:MAG: type II toxin-antitoxin system HicA family toxin [Deltaproteobacteria bacterium]|nr:type II toxin-antitoxin system HicA family toxin [Deltaproteobacteria bacterium]